MVKMVETKRGRWDRPPDWGKMKSYCRYNEALPKGV